MIEREAPQDPVRAANVVDDRLEGLFFVLELLDALRDMVNHILVIRKLLLDVLHILQSNADFALGLPFNTTIFICLLLIPFTSPSQP